jgi:hypothetical protein
MSTQRAEQVAEVLWELKKLQRYATLTAIARRAGFSPGNQLRTILSCMATVQKDWPHLESWRAIHDSGIVAKNSSQATALQAQGIELRDDGETWNVVLAESLMVVWDVSLAGAAIPVVAAK